MKPDRFRTPAGCACEGTVKPGLVPVSRGQKGSLHILRRRAVCSRSVNAHFLSVDLAVTILSSLEGGNRNLTKLIRPRGGDGSRSRGGARTP